MADQAFELAKIDYSAQRHAERRKLLRRSIAPVLLVVVAAVWFLMPTPLTGQAIGHYKQNRFSAARSWLSPLTLTSPQPFIADFDSGTIDTKLAKFSRAEAELNKALSIAPTNKLCVTAQNLVYALQAHAGALTKSAPQTSSQLAAKEQVVIKKYPSCFPTKSGGGGGGGSSNSSSQDNSPSKSQQSKLEQKDQAGRERQAKYANDSSLSPNNPSIKPW